MVKIERKDTQKAKAAIASLAAEKVKSSGTYNTPEVNDALQEMFAHKCYLCEQKGLDAIQIEHLAPHHNNRDLKFDWNNLFLACAHCNNTKNDRFAPILDCTHVDVDEKIAFRRHGGGFEPSTFQFTALASNVETQNTTALLQEIYSGSTPQKRAEAKLICQKAADELDHFQKCIREYQQSDGEDKKDAACRIRLDLKWNAPFAAFKRWIIRDKFPELINLIHMPT